MSVDEGSLERWGWRTLRAAGRGLGPRAGRALAAVVLRAMARSEAGWLEGVHRLATRPAPGAPQLTRLPEGWWAASPEVRVGRLGLRLQLDLRDNLQRTLYATGTYEPALLRFLHQELRRGDVMVDVGAHIGVHALTAAARLRDLGGGTVVAFEPARDSAAKLRAAAARNRLDVTVVEAALGAEPGSAELVGPASTAARCTSCCAALATSRPGRCCRSPTRCSAHGDDHRAVPDRLESSAVTSTGSFLARAVADARSDAERRAARLPLDAVKAAAAASPAARGLAAAVRRGPNGPQVIAEVKRRSPSRGDIRVDLDPAALATSYAKGGAAAVSVLTEPRQFAGSQDDLLAVRAAIDLPVLRKDFVSTAYQVWEARAWGADAVLLIVAALDPPALRALLDEAARAGLDALVEVHTQAEAETAAAAGATLVGVNARDLVTLEVDPGRFAAVGLTLPQGTVLVAESGIRTRADVQAAAEAGADAVLVGETLVQADDPTSAVRDLRTALVGMNQPAAAGGTTPLPAKH